MYCLHPASVDTWSHPKFQHPGASWQAYVRKQKIVGEVGEHL